MGGGGGGSYFPPSRPDLQELVRQTKERAHNEQFDVEVNRLLREVNGTFERDTESIRERLDQIADLLRDRGEMEQFLFGGSVAKHTFVDGLSDVDALVILPEEGPLGSVLPSEVIDRFASLLRTKLLVPDVTNIRTGQMAVTVEYKDGLEIQLLPAVRQGETVSIPPSSGTQWRDVRPRAFQQALSAANRDVGGTLVPTIKLLKSLNSDLPEQKRLTGYHIEALSMDAAAIYNGPTRMKEVLLHVIDHAAQRVLSPIKDRTGQSHNVDDYLGDANGTLRRIVADGLNTLSRRLSSAKTVEEWRAILDV